MNNIQHATRQTATGLRCNTTFMQHLFGATLLLCNTFWFHTNRRLDATLLWCHNSIKHSTVIRRHSGTLHWCNTTSIAMSHKAILMLQYNYVCLNCMPLPHYFDAKIHLHIMPHFYLSDATPYSTILMQHLIIESSALYKSCRTDAVLAESM